MNDRQNGSQNEGLPKPVDVRGVYRPHGMNVVVETPADLVRGKITVSDQNIKSTWGQEGLDEYLVLTGRKTIEQVHSEGWARHTEGSMGD